MQRYEVLQVIYPRGDAVRGRRFTQDTAIIPDVWIAFGTARDLSRRIELLLTPHASSDVQTLLGELRPRLARERGPDAPSFSLPYNESHVLVEANYAELIRAILPLSSWWQRHIAPLTLDAAYLDKLTALDDLEQLLFEPGYQDVDGNYPEALLDIVRITGAIAIGKPRPAARDVVAAFAKLTAGIEPATELPKPPPLWSVFCNRKAQGAIAQSRRAVKADAAVRVFDISAKGLVWAIVDSGIDATHPAFSRPAASQAGSISSRVLRTYDFTRLKDLMSANFEGNGHGSVFDQLSEDEQRDIRRDLQHRLTVGQPLDWKLVDPLLQIPHTCAGYKPPENEHGTHVAGILAADWKRAAGDLTGICADLEMYDLRVFDKNGEGDEFAILAALQFVRFLNQSKDRMSIHGVNLSFSLPHAVDSFGCGSTPVCEECERLAGAGVVVVAAAGNRGYRNSDGDQFEDYRNISITDPGNADSVITVGSTHRSMPHKYGVSYFSSRGPTGDGRLKPDLVAPGEKIESTVPGGSSATLDGTSMAAPHVSGAAALLMARHRELIGKPARVKEILTRTATDLGRDRSFQGAGMVDVLRALQSV